MNPAADEDTGAGAGASQGAGPTAARPAAPLLIVTRPLAQAADWVLALQALGHQAQALPLIGIAPVADPAPARAAWQRVHEFALLMFVSANAVQQFCALRPSGPAGLPWPVGTRAGSTGPGTTAALLAAGVPMSHIVQPPQDSPIFDSEALWSQLQHDAWMDRRVLVVRGEDGRDWLAQALQARGAAVEFVAAYQRQAPLLSAADAALLQQAQADPLAHLWLFSSSQALAHLQALAPQADWRQGGALASHPRIADTARGLGFGRVACVLPSVVAVSAALRAHAGHGPSIQSAAL